jgi:hypothetical protein
MAAWLLTSDDKGAKVVDAVADNSCPVLAIVNAVADKFISSAGSHFPCLLLVVLYSSGFQVLCMNRVIAAA